VRPFIRYKLYFLILLINFFLIESNAQGIVQMSVYSGESFYAHPGADVTIFSDINNLGSIGSYNQSTINFLGQRWNSRLGSRMMDESLTGLTGTGGIIRFSGSTFSQTITSLNAPHPNNAFPNLLLANPLNLMLQGNDLLVRRSFNFQSGRVILNNTNVVMEPGATIGGFDNTKFFVTGTTTTGGALVRRTTGSQTTQIVFPIGTYTGSYTPASIIYTGLAQD
jgi:hypothetical protein